MPTRTREINQKVFRQAEQALRAKIEALHQQELPNAMRAIAEEAVAHSRATHEYNNRSGALERSHFAEVLLPGDNNEIEFIGKGGVTVKEPVASGPEEITLVLGARQHYGFYVEVLYGFSVVLNTFLKLRREMGEQIGLRLRAKKLF